MSDAVKDEKLDDETLDNIVTLHDEAGNEIKFEFLDLIEHEGATYLVVLPLAAADEEEGMVVILQVLTSDDDAQTESYVSVEDEATLHTIYEIFKDRYRDDFDFAE